jgi:hypothetical protein
MSRILFYSPYATWGYHTALEATWAHSLKTRGADVQFVLCNGLSDTCDVYRANLNPRQGPNACLHCQKGATEYMFQLDMPYDWLGTYLPLLTKEKATAWAASLDNEELLDARWRDMRVGQWASATAYSQNRVARLDMDDPEVSSMFRGLLVGTVLNLEAMNTLLDTHRPDTLVLLNGRFFGHSVALELAKRKGIRFVTHERGFTTDTVRFAEQARTHELGGMQELWDMWQDVPLESSEFASAAQILQDRRYGRNFSRMSFSPPVQEQAKVKRELGLDERPLVVVFNSSDDETASFSDRREGAFPVSNNFLPAVVKLAVERPHLQFVIRIHPNISVAQAGTNQNALEHALQIQRTAPSNVRVVMPTDEVSSYTLVDLADVGVVYGSTIGLEMAASGKQVLCMAQSTYAHTGATHQVNQPGDLAPALDEALQVALSQGPNIETARRAMRWVYRYFREFSIPFDLVRGARDDSAPSLSYSSVAELLPGRHEWLDRICQYLMAESTSVVPNATARDRVRSQDPETLALEEWMRTLGEPKSESRAG